jgi:NAD(P)-dependent dehydrogenase (short-subunit alcohol dehydrogenase family)
MPEETNLPKGRVAIITGAAQGIGKAMAQVFAREGVAVAIADIQQAGDKVASDLRDAGGRALFVRTDLRQESDITAMIEATVNRFGRLDIVINNARPKLQRLRFAESLVEWDFAMDVLLKAPALVAKHAVPQMLKCGGGSIVNIASSNAFFISDQPAAYHVAKAGLLHLTRYLAYELGSQGIRVNAICPALVDLYDDGKPLTSDPVNRAVTELVVPLKRAASAEEVAKAAFFLCTDSAAYITGQVLAVDGGEMLGDNFEMSRKAFGLGKNFQRE